MVNQELPRIAGSCPGPVMAAFLACLLAIVPCSAQARAKTFDLGAWGTFNSDENLSVGAYIAAAVTGDVNETGWRVQGNFSYDRYSYIEWDGSKAIGATKEVNVLVGRSMSQGPVQFGVWAGPVAVVDSVSSPNSSSSRTDYGARFRLELSARLSRRLAFHANGNYSTVLRSYSGHASLHFPVSKDIQLSPEVGITGNRSYWQLKAGPAIGLRLNKLSSVTISGGTTLRNDGARSGYLGLGAGVNF